jgi:cyclic-di-AMP phosphodiesterase PgpH
MNKKLVSRTLHNYYGIFKILSFLAAAALVMWFMPRMGKFQYEFQKGKPWQHASLYAPFDFSVLKSASQIKDEKEKISKQIYPYFIYDLEGTIKGREHLESIIETEFSQNLQKMNRYQKVGLMLFDKIHSRGIVQHHKVIESLGADKFVNTVKDRVVTVYSLNDLFTITSAYEYCRRAIDTSKIENKNELLSLMSDVFVQNLIYDERITKQELEQAMQRISLTFGLVQKGEMIIAEGEPVDDEKYLILTSLRLENEQRTGSSNRIKAILTGQIILVLSIFIILFLFIRFLRNDVFKELKKINMILLLMLSTIIPSYLILHQSPTFVYLLPFGILPILLITFFDSRTTVLVHLLTIFLVSIVVPNAFQFVFLQLVVGYVVVFSLEKHNKRFYFFRTSLFIFLTYLVIYAGFSLMQVSSLTLIDSSMIWMFAVSASLTLLALPLIYLLERIFGQITDLSLLELSNTNSPLLRELASHAPGTFQHSIQVANLSEEALYEIGGDVLLARTGALYHDIGKMKNAYYFIENQMGGYNPHDDITPGESAAIIIDHVLEGIEMARKARLPEQIIDFIRTHHGTSRVNYFFVMEQRQNPGLTIDERDFRYKGPVPFSKETAVVMMADSVEAASRSLKNPTEQKINDLIENIISKQIESNQFLNANITFKEIHQVKKILKKKLLNIYHVRIAYPE